MHIPAVSVQVNILLLSFHSSFTLYISIFFFFFQQRANESTKRVFFLIGGAFGVDETVFTRANFTWSLSKLVFPHMIVRLVLAEQVYRACSIIRNEKYHHS